MSKLEYSHRGFWQDADMLQVCNYGENPRKGDSGMTTGEYTAIFATWATLASQLVLSANPASLMQRHKDCLAVLTNAEIVAVNQDALGAAPQLLFQKPSATSTTAEITTQGFARRMQDGAVAVVLLNRGTADATMAVTWSELGLPAGSKCAVRDVIAKVDLKPAVGGGGTTPTTVSSHHAQMLRIKCTAD